MTGWVLLVYGPYGREDNCAGFDFGEWGSALNFLLDHEDKLRGRRIELLSRVEYDQRSLKETIHAEDSEADPARRALQALFARA